MNTQDPFRRLNQQNEAKRKLEIDLFNNTGLAAAGVPWNVAEKVFAKAWEDGHASGEHEVAMHYEEIAEIAQAAFVAASTVDQRVQLLQLKLANMSTAELLTTDLNDLVRSLTHEPADLRGDIRY